MSHKEMAFKIEELMVNAEKIHSLQNTLFAVFYCQEEYSVRDFEPAFILLGDMTYGMLDELKNLTNSVFEIIEKDVKNDDK